MIQHRSLSLTWSATFLKKRNFLREEKRVQPKSQRIFGFTNMAAVSFFSVHGTLVGSLSNDDSDGNEDGEVH